MSDLIHGDCADVLRETPDASVDSCVTDPPYGIDFMGAGWDSDVPPASIWREVLRVLKPGGHLLAFAGTRTHHRMATRIEDAGFEIRDMVAWVYGSGFPKSRNLADEWEGWGTALKPAMEPITMARKPLIGTVAANVLKHGTGALNIEGCRVHSHDSEGYAYKVQRMMPGAGQNATGKTHQEGVEFQGHTKDGRWPANLIHDGSDEVLAAFPDSKGQQGFVGARHGVRHGVNAYGDYGPRPDAPPRGDSGSAARFFYCAKASKADRDDGLAAMGSRPSAASEFRPNHAEKAAAGEDGNPYGRWAPRKNHHPTVKPTKLMRYLCRLVTPPGGVVLDPFAGSGSTGRGAVLEGFRFIGIEREDEYIAIARARIAAAEAALVSRRGNVSGLDLFRWGGIA